MNNVLYVDGSKESKKAHQWLKRVGLKHEVFPNLFVDARAPILRWNGDGELYIGLGQIKSMVIAMVEAAVPRPNLLRLLLRLQRKQV